MTFAGGMSEALYLGFEQSFKVLPADVDAFKVPVINPRYTPAVGRFTSDALTGRPQPRPPAFGKQGLDWTLDLECNKQSMAPFLKAHFGTPVSQAGVTGWNDHYYGFGSMLSLFMEERHTDLSKFFVYQGKYCGNMDVTLDAEGLLKATFGGIGAFMRPTFATTVINGDITDYTGDLPLNMVAGIVKIAGQAVGYFQQIALRSSRNLDKRNHIDGTTQVGVIFSQLPTVEVTVRASFQDTTLLEKAIANQEPGIIEFYVLEAGTGHGVKFTMPTVIFRPATVETAGTGLCNVNLTGDAYARGSASDTAAEALGKYCAAPITGLTGKTLVIKPDALTEETFTMTAAEESGGIEAVAAKINGTAVGLKADNEGSRLRVLSKTFGTSSKIRIQPASTGLTELGFVASVDYLGLESQSLVARLSNGNLVG